VEQVHVCCNQEVGRGMKNEKVLEVNCCLMFLFFRFRRGSGFVLSELRSSRHKGKVVNVSVAVSLGY
jgi:hypothetical protein